MAPPTALLHGLADPAGALLAAGTLIAAMLAVAWSPAALRPAADLCGVRPRLLCVPLAGGAAVLALQLASAELLSTHVAGAQMLVSAGWALLGTALLIAGLRIDLRTARLAGLGLLLATLAKVLLLDLATLDPTWRAASFLVLGPALLAGAFAWQRARPRPVPDLRETPAALR